MFSRRPAVQQNRGRVGNTLGFKPTSIPGNILWLRADKGITLATGVSTWADQSGNGNNFTQGTGANQPTLSTLNGQPALPFNGTSQSLSRSANLVGFTNLTIFLVIKYPNATPTAAQQIYCWQDTASTGVSIGNSAGNARVIGAVNVASMVGGAMTTNAEIWQIQQNGTNWSLLVNGSNASLTNSTSSPASGGTITTIGGRSTGIQFYPGILPEVIVYNSSIGTASATQVRQYLGARYAIATT